jgi:hypothetical protein
MGRLSVNTGRTVDVPDTTAPDPNQTDPQSHADALSNRQSWQVRFC